MIRHVLLRNLTELASHSGLSPIKRLQAIWPVLLEAPIGQRTRPERIDGEQLVVLVETPVLGQELNLHSRRLCNLLHRNKLVPDSPKIRTIVARVAPRGTFPPTRYKARPRAVPTPDPPPEHLSEALTVVQDPDLRAQLSRLCRFQQTPSPDEEP